MILLRFLLLVFNVAIIGFLIYRMVDVIKKTNGDVEESHDTHWRHPVAACADGNISEVFCRYSPVFCHLPGSHLYVPIPYQTTLDQMISMASP